MFKPQTFRFKNTIHWPGVGPASEIAASNISKVDSDSDNYTFVHASGHAVKVPKAEVTAYGVFDADDVPNLPKEEDYQDDISKLEDKGAESTRVGGHFAPLPTAPVVKESEESIDDDAEDRTGEEIDAEQSSVDTDANDKSTDGPDVGADNYGGKDDDKSPTETPFNETDTFADDDADDDAAYADDTGKFNGVDSDNDTLADFDLDTSISPKVNKKKSKKK